MNENKPQIGAETDEVDVGLIVVVLPKDKCDIVLQTP